MTAFDRSVIERAINEVKMDDSKKYKRIIDKLKEKVRKLEMEVGK